MTQAELDSKTEPFETELKDGRIVLIREATIADVPALINSVKTIISDNNENQVMEADEFDPTVGSGREWVQSFTERENSLLLLALHHDRIVGNLDISGAHRRRLKHNGLVGLSMMTDFRNSGLGTSLLNTAINWAKENPILTRLWAQVVSNNEGALNLYKRAGFQEEGRQKDFIRISEGVYADNILMYLNLS